MARRDWYLKVRIGLAEEPEVLALATRLGLAPDHVVGLLVRFWGWAKRVTRDGELRHVSDKEAEALLGCSGFTAALRSVGWLNESGDFLSIHDFGKYLAQEQHQRRLASERQRRKRERDKEKEDGRYPSSSPVTAALPKRDVTVMSPFPSPGGISIHSETKTPSETGVVFDSNTPLVGGGVGGGVTPSSRVTRKPKAKTETTPEFDRFWSAYPRHDSKQESFHAWTKLAPDAALIEVILAALAKQKLSEQWLRDEGRFIPHASSWLNKRRWEDELTVRMPQGASYGTSKRPGPGVQYDPALDEFFGQAGEPPASSGAVAGGTAPP